MIGLVNEGVDFVLMFMDESAIAAKRAEDIIRLKVWFEKLKMHYLSTRGSLMKREDRLKIQDT